jgi:FdhD protein
MRTPGHDFELAAGFLMTEGVVSDSADISEIFYVSGRSGVAEPLPPDINESDDMILPYQPERNIVRIELSPDVPVSLANLERNFYTTSLRHLWEGVTSGTAYRLPAACREHLKGRG